MTIFIIPLWVGPPPAGMTSDSRTAAIRRLGQIKGWKLGVSIGSLSALALLLVVVGRDLPGEVPEQSSLEIVSEQIDGSADLEKSGRLPNSIAVLPFDNLSPDPDHAYFAAGIHDEILNQLAKIRDISVISRTSVLRYTDNRPTIPEIADELNVETVLEAAVRVADQDIVVRRGHPAVEDVAAASAVRLPAAVDRHDACPPAGVGHEKRVRSVD